jgi:hypothetical protein
VDSLVGTVAAIVAFLVLQFVARFAFLRPALAGNRGRASTSAVMGASIASLPVLATSLAKAPWSLDTVLLATAILFMSASTTTYLILGNRAEGGLQ